MSWALGVGKINPAFPLDVNGSCNVSGGDYLIDGYPVLSLIDGYIAMTNLPTSSANLPPGALWNNAGVLSVIADAGVLKNKK